MECRQPVRFAGLADQAHAGFFGCASALPVIAAEACRDNVVPTLLAAARNGDDVVECKILRRKFLSTVLTRVIVARVDVCAGKLDPVVILYSDVLEEPDDRGKLDRKRDRANLLVVLVN